MRTPADRGEGVLKGAIFCGHPLCMTPNDKGEIYGVHIAVCVISIIITVTKTFYKITLYFANILSRSYFHLDNVL